LDAEKNDIHVFFEQGLAAGLDPDSSVPAHTTGESAADRKIVTSLRSRWLYGLCGVCGHNFRLGDEVRILENGSVVHDLPGLRCAGGDAPQDVGGAEDRGRFFKGLATAWPMAADVPVKRLEPGDPLLAPPHQGHARAICRVCGYTFRVGDHVVVCPCSPGEPRCRAAVHRDLLRQLHCWDQWMRRREELIQKGKGEICLGMS